MSESTGTTKSNEVTREYLLDITAAPEVIKSVMESFETRLPALGIEHVLAPNGFCKECARVVADAQDNYFGVCPKCHKTNGYINIGRSHWFNCKEHKTCWCIGANLFSSCDEETEEEQRSIFDALGFGEFEDVKPHHCYFGE